MLVRVSFLLRKLNKTQGGSTKYKIPGRAHKTGPVVVGLLFPIWGSLYCNTALWLQIENGWISLLSWVSWWRHLQNYVDEASIPSFASRSVSQSLNTNAQNKFLTAFLIYFIFSQLANALKLNEEIVSFLLLYNCTESNSSGKVKHQYDSQGMNHLSELNIGHFTFSISRLVAQCFSIQSLYCVLTVDQFKFMG